MNIASYIEHLRSKPEYIRRRIALWSSLGFTAIVFMFWVASFTSIGTSTQAAFANMADRAQSPAQSFVAGIGSIAGDIRNMFVGSKKVEYKPVEVSPGKN